MNIQIKLSGLAHGGACIGTVITPEDPRCGKKAFVRDAIPGEVVDAEIVEEQKSLIQARLLQVLTPSPHRISPPCKYFGSCGGCDLQHMAIELQRNAKRDMVETMLRMQGGILPRDGVILADAPLPAYGYRRRIGLHLDQSGSLGFYRSGTGEVIDIDHCLISSERINQALHVVRGFARELAGEIAGIILEEINDDIAILLRPRDTSRVDSSSGSPIAKLKESIARITIEGATSREDEELMVGHFSQVNSAGNMTLQALVLEHVSQPTVTDLYAGAGNFSIPLAQTGKKVVAVELDRSLIQEGQRLARVAGVQDLVTFHTSSCEQFVKRNNVTKSVVLDPPRSGAKEVVQRFASLKVEEIIYISCNLPSLVRDLKALQNQGYETVKVVVVDMFAQTHHVESVAIVRNSSVSAAR